MTELSSISKLKRKVFRAFSRSQQSIENAIKENIDDFNSSIYADVGTAGETILSKTPDTQDLDIEMWNINIVYRTANSNSFSLGPAQVLREDVKHKMLDDLKTEQQIAYENINGYIARCLPNEFREEQPRALARDPETGLQISPSDYRWTGDVSGTMIFGRAKNTFLQKMRGILKGALKFIEFIVPTSSDSPVTYNPLEKKIEGKDVLIDIKGNKIVKTDPTKETSGV